MEELKQEVQQIQTEESQVKKKPSKAYKIISIILFALWGVGYLFITALLVSCTIEAFAEGGWAWVGFALIFALGLIVYAVVCLIALAGLITTIVCIVKAKKQYKLTGYLIAFIVLTVMPIISEVAFYLVATLIN